MRENNEMKKQRGQEENYRRVSQVVLIRCTALSGSEGEKGKEIWGLCGKTREQTPDAVKLKLTGCAKENSET